MSTTPNLFDYATSELSQDAFFAWLIAHASCRERDEMRSAALAFIAFLWNSAHQGEKADASHVRLAEKPQRQVDGMDIVFVADVFDRKTVFLIEDKTHTSHHDDQLARYRERLNDKYPSHERVLTYLKTGFHFGEDARAKDHGYSVVGLDDVIRQLRATPVESEIYSDYLASRERLRLEREAAIAMLGSQRGHDALGNDVAQYAFVKRLSERCPLSIQEAKINHGRSLGGAPWTHLRFARFEDVYGKNTSEALFHRVDRRKEGFYLSTRQYALVKSDAMARAKKKERLGRLRGLFEEATRDSALRFARPTTDNTGANESEIGVLFFDDETNSVSRVLDGFPSVHARFLGLLEEQLVRTG